MERRNIFLYSYRSKAEAERLGTGRTKLYSKQKFDYNIVIMAMDYRAERLSKEKEDHAHLEL